jgi:hypothetical protein
MVKHASGRTRAALIPWVVFALVSGALGWASFRGFDLTDESYYLAWISQPSRYGAGIHPFGLFFHPVYQALGQSLVSLRIVGVAMLAGTGALLGLYLERYYRRAKPSGSPVSLVCLGGLYGLAYYAGAWIMTPSYNMLANAGGALVMAGVMGWSSEGGTWSKERIPSVCVGVGGFMAALGKPTFAGLAAAGVLCFLLFAARSIGVRAAIARASLALATCLALLAAAVWANEGFAAEVKRIVLGLQLLDFGYSIADLPRKAVHDLYATPALVALSVAVLTGTLIASRFSSGFSASRSRVAILLGTVLACDLAVLAISGGLGVTGGRQPFGLVGGPLLAAGVAAVAFSAAHPSEGRGVRDILPVLALLLMPAAIAFGAAGNLVEQTLLSAFGVLLASAVAAHVFSSGRAALTLQWGGVLVLIALLGWSALVPYGLPAPVWRQHERMSLPSSADPIYVDGTTSEYVRGVQQIAAEHEFVPGTPVMDLSGGGPGTVLVMRGVAPLYPWPVHIFPESWKLADRMWASLDAQEQESAWIVGPVHPAFARSQPARMLASGYVRAGQARMRFWNQDRVIEFWRPASPQITEDQPRS